jgi:hypothetical protein
LSASGADPASNSVTLYLKNGDHISGVIVAEATNRLTLSNTWASEISVPLDQIARRQSSIALSITNSTPHTSPSGQPAISLAASTNHWKGEAQFGVNLIKGATDSYLYYTRMKLAYQLPYESDPKHLFKSDVDYKWDFGKTEGVESVDRMYGLSHTSFDFDGQLYVYLLGGAGYDRIKTIDLQYEAGPGLGWHAIAATNFTVNFESGLDYQVQYRSDSPDTRNVYFRIAEEVLWKVRDRMSVMEKVEYFPRVNFQGYRIRGECTISYDIWKHIALNFTLLDLYDTDPAPDVAYNELQIRSTLGVKF